MKFDKIIIEGPNNVGKSTLINGLMEYLRPLNWEVEHTSQLCPNDFDFYDHVLSNEEPMVFDRLHVGEMVYPEFYNRPGKISRCEFEELLFKHDEHVLHVFVDADYEFIVQANSIKNEKFNFNEVALEKELFYNYYQFIKDNYKNCIRIKNHIGDHKSKAVKTILEAIGYDIVN